ncbi:class I SAM-dependent methyltransferase [Congregibacter sp.]|jgi:SAM-dependent methyltransferase|uniref:class I SAM-dependent methyltransferase n=1 Tax=Congregibacter sp. TaxID=2744308 RepID=UPI0039E46E19
MFKSYRDIFSQRADSYHRAMRTWPKARDQEFFNLLSCVPIEKFSRVCDLPAGGGYLYDYLAPLEVNYTALEQSDIFYQSCPQSESCQRMIAEFSDIPLPDKQFDLIYSLAGLHHIKERAPVYAEMYRLLDHGGYAVIADVYDGTPTASFLNGFVDQHCSGGHEGIFLNKQDEIELQAVGFELLESQLRDFHWRFPSVEAMCEYCAGMFGLDLSLPERTLQGIDSSLGFRKLDGFVEMKWSLLFLTLKKSN